MVESGEQGILGRAPHVQPGNYVGDFSLFNQDGISGRQCCVMDRYTSFSCVAGWQDGVGSLTCQHEHPKSNDFL